MWTVACLWAFIDNKILWFGLVMDFSSVRVFRALDLSDFQAIPDSQYKRSEKLAFK